MQSDFRAMLNIVPSEVRLASQEFFSEYIDVFEPTAYVIGQKLHFDHYHFIIFYSHPPLLKIDGEEYQFCKGSLISFVPGMNLTVLPCNPEITAKYLSISINKEFFEAIASDTLGTGKIEIRGVEHSYSSQLLDFVRSFKVEILRYGHDYPAMINSIASQIAFQLLREINKSVSVCEEGNHVSAQKYVNKAIEYMQGNYNSNIRIEEISREIYVSRAHFGRMFKHYTGQTPNQYLTGIRLQKAKEMLKKHEFSIEEIARLCGFINLGHFSSTFRRLEGITPTKYRNE